MKKLILICPGVMIALFGHAQLELRPSVGMNFTNVTEAPDGARVNANAGWQGGASAMIGNQLYFEPGFIISPSAPATRQSLPFSRTFR